MQTAIAELNYDISFVQVVENKVQPWYWSHGVIEHRESHTNEVQSTNEGTRVEGNSVNEDLAEQALGDSDVQPMIANFEHEYELITSLNGPAMQIIRINDVLTYLDQNQGTYSVKSQVLDSPLPEILRADLKQVALNYQFTLVGNSRVAGHKARLIRVTPKDKQRYSLWLWLHHETALPLKTAIVDNKGEVLSQNQVASYHVSSKVSQAIDELAALNLNIADLQHEPARLSSMKFDWHLSWIPQGFYPAVMEKRQVGQANELAKQVDYMMLSDGLVWFSLYVRLLSPNEVGQVVNTQYTAGAETYTTLLNGPYEVTVIGAIPTETATKIAESVEIEFQ